MRTFNLVPPATALERLHAAMRTAQVRTQIERISALDADARVIAEDIASPTAMPDFRRSTMDGFAVRSIDGLATRRIVGEVSMGQNSPIKLGMAEAARIHTGGELPEDADAVLPVEDVTLGRQSEGFYAELVISSRVLRAGENCIEVGEDVHAGDLVIRAGTRLRTPELGGLAALGHTFVRAYARPRVAVLASGDEVVPPDAVPIGAQVRDINTNTISNLIRQAGGIPVSQGILRDDANAFELAARRAMADCDALVFMAGSSVSERDFTPDVIARLGAPGVLQHGVQFRPGKPTLFALCDGKPVFGLPGNPVSALVTALLFVQPTLWLMQGALNPPHPVTLNAVLDAPIRSPKTLEHWLPVSLTVDRDGNHSATPIASKSNLIFSLTRAQGLVCAPIGVELMAAGTPVQVRML